MWPTFQYDCVRMTLLQKCQAYHRRDESFKGCLALWTHNKGVRRTVIRTEVSNSVEVRIQDLRGGVIEYGATTFGSKHNHTPWVR